MRGGDVGERRTPELSLNFTTPLVSTGGVFFWLDSTSHTFFGTRHKTTVCETRFLAHASSARETRDLDRSGEIGSGGREMP